MIDMRINNSSARNAQQEVSVDKEHIKD